MQKRITELEDELTKQTQNPEESDAVATTVVNEDQFQMNQPMLTQITEQSLNAETD